jgi:hypothetical protein
MSLTATNDIPAFLNEKMHQRAEEFELSVLPAHLLIKSRAA